MPTAARRNDGTVNDRRRPRVPAKPKPAPQLTGPIQLDDETRNALILFNARLVAQDELEREKRRVDKAAKAKDEAAAKVRQVENDPSATAEQRAEAQAGYLASLDALNRAKSGEPAAVDDAPADSEDDEADAPTDEATADEPAADEVAASDEPTADEVATTDEATATEPAATDDEPAATEEVAATDDATPEAPANEADEDAALVEVTAEVVDAGTPEPEEVAETADVPGSATEDAPDTEDEPAS